MNLIALEAPVRETHALTLRIVTSPDALRAVRADWQELLEDSACVNPMCGPDWILTWWDLYGRDRELRVGLFFEGERLVALAPLCRRIFWHRPGIPFRRLEFLGSDVDENDGVCSEYLSLITRRGFEDRVLPVFADSLDRGVFGSWDECVLSAMDGTAESTKQLTTALRRMRASLETTQTTAAPFLTLPATWDDYLRSFNKKKRQSLTYALRDFHAWAGDDLRLEIARTPEELEKGLRSLIDLHEQRWQAEDHGGAFAAPRFQAFHERFARLVLQQQRLLLMTVVVRGQAAAALYAFQSDHKLCFYQCGRILSAPPKVRLGIVTVIFAMQQAMKLGLREFDFLGGQAQYKQLFTSTERPIMQLRLARRGVREWLRRAARSSACALARVFSARSDSEHAPQRRQRP